MKSGIWQQKAQMSSDKERERQGENYREKSEGVGNHNMNNTKRCAQPQQPHDTQKISQLPWQQLGKCVKMAIFYTNTLRETLSYSYTDTRILRYFSTRTHTHRETLSLEYVGGNPVE